VTTPRDAKSESAAARRLINLAGGGRIGLDEAVEKVAQQLLDGVQVAPTNLESLFPKLQIRDCHPDADLAVLGELRAVRDGFSIAYFPDQEQRRLRFTIAHELGHAILETTGARAPRRGDEVERICDKLASALLMPRREFLARCGRGSSLKQVAALSETFNCSLTAVLVRFASFFRYDIFVCEAGRITWGFGRIHPRAIAANDSRLRMRLAEIVAGERSEGITQVDVGFGQAARFGNLEWLKVHKHKAFFLFR
jgi:hypothetical protein